MSDLIQPPLPSDQEQLLNVLQLGIEAYHHSQEVRSREIEVEAHKQNIERLKVEREYEIRQQTIGAHTHATELRHQLEHDRFLFEKEQYNRGYWLLVVVLAFIALIVILLLIMAPNHEQRLSIVQYLSIAISLLLGGRGLSTLLPSRTSSPSIQPPPAADSKQK